MSKASVKSKVVNTQAKHEISKETKIGEEFTLKRKI
jgi:hypothetical protein